MPNILQIKKYPNRRYYDATRSCHVTLQEVYDLVRAGNDIVVNDSRTGEDITNLILFQVLLEHDQPKLDLFPSSILHMMIRANRQALHATFEGFFGPFLRMVASSQRQFDSYVRQAVSTPLGMPLDWANQMMRAFSPGQPSSNGYESASDGPPDSEPPVANDSLDELRRQVAILTQQIEDLRSTRAG